MSMILSSGERDTTNVATGRQSCFGHRGCFRDWCGHRQGLCRGRRIRGSYRSARCAGAELAKSLGASASYSHLDVRLESDWTSVIDSILKAHGKLDILVNNAGITGFESPAPQDPENVTMEDWHAVLATTLDGTSLGCKHAPRQSAIASSFGGCTKEKSVQSRIRISPWESRDSVVGWLSCT